jgi:hypothetical protein
MSWGVAVRFAEYFVQYLDDCADDFCENKQYELADETFHGKTPLWESDGCNFSHISYTKNDCRHWIFGVVASHKLSGHLQRCWASGAG